MENGKQHNFQEFYREWRDEQKQQLHHLVVASKADPSSSSSSSSLSVLVASVLAHYENYYKTKSRCAKTNVFLLLSPPWITQLEDAFIWVGGWRPTTAFHLLFSKSGLQFEAKFSAVQSGGPAVPLDLGDLSSDQLVMIDNLQRITVAEERRITEKAAKQQERVAETEMVELSQIASESTQVEAFHNGRVQSALKAKEEGFRKILQSADDLRLGTLKAVVEILSPIQAVHFLIAAGELLLRLHDWGIEQEESEAGNEAVL